MSCLVQLHSTEAIWFNVDAITTIFTESQSKGWEIDYSGPPSSTQPNGMMLGREIYTTKDDMEARMRFIEKMVNTKCGTTTFRIKKLK